MSNPSKTVLVLITVTVSVIVCIATFLLLRTATGNAPSTPILSDLTPPLSLPLRVETRHLTIYTDLPLAEAERLGRFFDAFYDFFSTTYYPLVQEKKLKVFLFGTVNGYATYYAERYPGAAKTAAGRYMGLEASTILICHPTGLGTAAHEMAHHFLSLGGIDSHPLWVNEGVPTFFEKFIAYENRSGDIKISVGYFSDWRFTETKREIGSITPDRFWGNQNQNWSRSFMLYLHRKGYMVPFVQALQQAGHQADPQHTLEEISGQSGDQLLHHWKNWVLAQPLDADVKLVRPSMFLTPDAWQTWQSETEGSLHWNAEAKRFAPAPSSPL